MTVNELKTLNNLTNNVLNIGQRLKVVKNDMPSANVYIVKSGDSLYSIAIIQLNLVILYCRYLKSLIQQLII